MGEGADRLGMKYALLSLFLAVLITGSVAQSRDNVKTLSDLYVGCVRGYLQAGIPKSNSEIKEYVGAVEHNCILWTAVWFESFTSESMYGLRDIELARFSFFMEKVRRELIQELVALTR